jgi:multidrug resistance efflux pump
MSPNRSSLVAGTVAAVFLLSGCHQRPTVEKSKADGKDERHWVDASVITAPGTVEPWSGEVKLASMEPGQLGEILVTEGQLVHKGELLARLEDSQQRHAVAIAQAEVRQAAAILAGASSTNEELRAAAAELQAATVRAEQQRRESERAATLGASGVLAAAEVERVTSAAGVEEAAREAAEARQLAVKRGARHSERQLLKSRWEAAEARLKDAGAALARREVRATIDGVVLWSRQHVGEYYSQTQGPLFVLGDMQHPQLRLEVDDGDAGLVLEGARCKLRSDSGQALGTGTVVRIAAAFGTRSLSTERPSSRTDARVREVFVAIDTPTALAHGQRVWGQIDRATRHAAR